jgi:peptide/nickel transport system permease protein
VGSRLLWSLLTIALSALGIFVLLDLAPGDAASRIAGESATPEMIATIRKTLGLDHPLYQRAGDWLGSAVQGDLGRSLITNEPVTSLVSRALPPTLSLLLVSAIMALVLAVGASLLSAIRPGGALDTIVVTATTVALAIPSFWLAIVLANYFAVQQGWLPAVGYASLSNGFRPWLEHLLLPAFALAFVSFAEIARQLRGGLHDALKQDYILSARMRGFGSARILTKHALKNAALPAVTVFGVRLAQLLGGTVVIERVFGINGLGTLLSTSVASRDIPVVLGVVVVFAVIVTVINFFVDLSYAYFDPRQR